MSGRSRVIVALASLWLVGAASAQEPAPPPTVTSEQLRPGLHVLYGSGGGQSSGNVLVLFGDRRALVVDTGYPQFVPKYRDEIARLGGGAITHAINTHWHDDHSEGNKLLGPDAFVANTRPPATEGGPQSDHWLIRADQREAPPESSTACTVPSARPT